MNNFFPGFLLGFAIAALILLAGFAVYVLDRLPTIVENSVKAVLSDYTVTIEK